MTETMTDRHYPIQSLLWPELGVSTEQHIYFRLSGPAGFSSSRRQIELTKGGHIAFDTAANLFNLRKWNKHCGLDDLSLRIDGAGRFEITVFQTSPVLSWERIHEDIAVIPDSGSLRIDLTPMLQRTDLSVLFFTLTALDDAIVTGAAWETAAEPRRTPALSLAITTFKREEAVAASVARFEAFVQTSPIAEHLHLIVVDNGNSASLAASDHVTPIVNKNLGGSGGFARGLFEAQRRGSTHCLFMDDDALIHMPALERTWWFLSYTKNLDVAVSGGLTRADARWQVWESGAVFDRHCFPQWHNFDLRHFPSVLAMEHEGSKPKPANFYGGWWYFAFAIERVRNWPFPFFVRGDDISFSIANKLDITTLPGVMCFQDADFADKESLTTLYLDMRSHMVHHIVLPYLDRGRFEVFRVMAWFFMRSMIQCHYETLEALNLAAEDVLKGPQFFAENADMAARRASLNALRKTESWAPVEAMKPQERRRFDPHRSRFRHWLLKYSLNGHLLPFFRLFGNRIVLNAGQRGQLHPVWGASSITYISSDGEQSFTVQHSKLRAYRQGIRMLRNMVTLLTQYDQLRSSWLSGYRELTTKSFWAAKFDE
ncbi:MAG: glycosyltransferase [Rhodobacter sp.]|nr:glycosyltransferase [Paracoccaceae bacterium]MCC0077399.1 glycosyltransferase [Rhodobacter sp.]